MAREFSRAAVKNSIQENNTNIKKKSQVVLGSKMHRQLLPPAAKTLFIKRVLDSQKFFIKIVSIILFSHPFACLRGLKATKLHEGTRRKKTVSKPSQLKSFGRSRNPFSKGFLAAGGNSWRWILVRSGVDKIHNFVKIFPTNLVILGFWLSVNDSKIREKTRLGEKFK